MLVAGAGCSSGDGGDADASPTPTGLASAAAASGGEVAIGAPTSVVTPATTTTAVRLKVEFTTTVGPGDRGAEVAYLQQRLKDLRFDPGPVDGAYGPSVEAAVWAYQKLIGLSGDDVTGEVTPELWSSMQDPFVLQPQIADGGTHLEVYLPQQVMVLFKGNQAELITHVSTGNDEDWCEKGVCGIAVTPGGTYEFQRRVDGWREAELGLLYNPVYFNGGIAVHGALSVPTYPASHGCVRIPMHIANYFPTLVADGDKVFVFDGKKDPRDYGAQPPPPNRKDPNYVGPDVTFDDRDQTDNTAPGPPATADEETDDDEELPEITAAPGTSPPATEAPVEVTAAPDTTVPASADPAAADPAAADTPASG